MHHFRDLVTRLLGLGVTTFSISCVAFTEIALPLVTLGDISGEFCFFSCATLLRPILFVEVGTFCGELVSDLFKASRLVLLFTGDAGKIFSYFWFLRPFFGPYF